jgi:branched-chain amino acid transport system substrate-binding protein
MAKQLKLLFVLAMLLGCMPGVARGDITFAVVGGMSGPFEPIGNWFKNGAQGAVDEINRTGGLLGHQVKFVVRDDHCNPDKAVEIANDVAAEKIPFVMGHLCSDASIAASEIYEKSGIIEISPSSTNPLYTERNFSNVFRTTGRDDMQGFVIAEQILRHFKFKELGIIHDDTAYSRGIVDVAKKFLTDGGKEAAFLVQAPGEPYDFSAIIKLIKAKKVGILLYPALPAQLASFLKQAAKAGVKPQLIGGDTFTNVVLDKADMRLLDGTQFSFPPDPADDRRNKKLVKIYKAAGVKPEAFTFYSYGAVQVWAEAVRRAGSVDAAKVSAVLKSEEFETVLGNISFDEKGDISKSGFVIYIYNRGKKYYYE